MNVFHRARLTASALAALTLALAVPSLSAQVPSPESHFGFRMGTDRELASSADTERYFEAVAASSDRVRILDIGATTEGHRTIAAIVSAPDNIQHLNEIRAANQRLADPRTLAPEEARRLAATHKAVLAIGAGIHASEVGATQAANELLHTLASSTDAATLAVLQNVIVILIPSLNPDGHRLVVDWYRKNRSTPFEGGPMPWLYHKYAGHDINRDAFMMNLAESRNLARFFYTEWHPQVFLTMHQMESNGPRFFAPPNADPIDPNYDPLFWREAALLGSAMTLELERDGHRGVLSNAAYDYYWPGYEDSAPIGHNTVCLLTEVASVRVATPIEVPARELRGGLRGLPEYRPQINFPDPWPGGSWTLRDIVDYDLSAVRGLLHGVSAYREQIVQNFYEMGRNAIEKGKAGGPFAFILPPEQHDPQAVAKLENLLLQGSIEIHRALEPFRADGDPYPAGTDIILLAQPYRAYVKTLLERQDYPGRRATANQPPDRPYDVAGWMLPAQMGVDVRTIARSFEPPAMSRITSASVPAARIWGDRTPAYYVIEARGNAGALAVNRLLAAKIKTAWLTSPLAIGGYRYELGSIVATYSKSAQPIVERIATELGLRADAIAGKPPTSVRSLEQPRVGLYKPWVENIDEGWTRWLLEQYEFPFKNLSDNDVRAGNLRSLYDAIIIPSASAERLLSGYPSNVVPAEYAGGLDADGVAALRAFVESGGTLICLDQAGNLAIGAFRLPVRDLVREPAADAFFCPGSILRVDLDAAHPLAYGMSEHTAGFFAFGSAYDLLPNAASSDAPSAVETIVRYGTGDPLVSGWLEGGQLIAGRAAVVRARVGTGHVVLLGFSVQHRGQSYATFRLLFNSIFDSTSNATASRAR